MSFVLLALHSDTCSFMHLWFVLYCAGSTKVFWLCAKVCEEPTQQKNWRDSSQGSQGTRGKCINGISLSNWAWCWGLDASSNLRSTEQKPLCRGFKVWRSPVAAKITMGMSQSTKKALEFSHVFDPELMCAQWSSVQGLLSHYTILWLHETNLKVSLHSVPSIYDIPVFFVSITLQTILNKMSYHSICIRA